MANEPGVNDTGQHRATRRRRALAVTALALAALLACRVALRGSPPVYPTGDQAVLELYTLYAAEGPWPFGPYSRFGWHHPGPLFFYWALPWHLASGQHSLGMNAGALALSVASLGGLLALLARATPPAVSGCASIAFALYALRLGTLSTAVWNPLVVALPTALLVALGAGLAAGRWRLLPWLAAVASLVVQTHVSAVPAVAVVVSVSLLLAWRGGAAADDGDGSAPRAAAAAAVVLGIAWVLPVTAALRHAPGSLGALAAFFLTPAPAVTWAAALAPWSALLSAPFSPSLSVPVGVADASPLGAVGLLVAGLHLCGLGAVAWGATRARRRMLAALAGLGAAVVLAALWSLTRVRGPIGDYLTFWLSAVAVLNWSVILGGALVLSRSAPAGAAGRYRHARIAAVVATTLVAGGGVRDLAQRAREAAGPLDEGGRQVRDLADAVTAHVRAAGYARPRLAIAGKVWAPAAGIVLELRKRGVAVTVEGDVDYVFAARPVGTEDGRYGIADPETAAARGAAVTAVARAGDLVVVTSNR